MTYDCIICGFPLRKTAKLTPHKHNKGLYCRIAHPHCIAIMAEFHRGSQGYWQLLSSHGLRDNAGFPVGRFPRMPLCQRTIENRYRKARSLGYYV